MCFLTQINAFTSSLVQRKIQSMCCLNNNCADYIEFKTEQIKNTEHRKTIDGFFKWIGKKMQNYQNPCWTK